MDFLACCPTETDRFVIARGRASGSSSCLFVSEEIFFLFIRSYYTCGTSLPEVRITSHRLKLTMSTASLWGDQTFPDLEFPLWKAVTAVAMGLATAACGTRLYVRGSMVGKIGVDDYILVVAYVSVQCRCISSLR